MTDDFEFARILGEQYTQFEDALDAEHGVNEVRQLWHTPTELFNPHYGYAIARYLITNYKLSLYPYHDLVIYEMGAGNGTLMTNILDYIRSTDPDVYERTQYKVIEISTQLAELQRAALSCHTSTATSRSNSTISNIPITPNHAPRVEIINKSIFTWDTHVPTPCFFLALEVFDNFAHDMIRYDFATGTPMQGMVLIDSRGDFHEFYTPHLDPLASRFLDLRKRAHPQRKESALWALWKGDPLWMFKHSNSVVGNFAKKIHSNLPLATNLSKPEFIPTRLVQFFEVLKKWFPEHRLVTADFHKLPDTIEGANAPVVQTRYRRITIPVSTVYVCYKPSSLSLYK